MSKLEELLKMIKDYPPIITYNELHKCIINNSTYVSMYNEITEIQKKLVNAKYSNNTKEQNEFEVLYNKRLDHLLSFPVVNEYLNSIEEINQLINTITSIVEVSINRRIKRNS